MYLFDYKKTVFFLLQVFCYFISAGVYAQNGFGVSLSANEQFSPVGGDTNQGSTPWAVSPPATFRASLSANEQHNSSASTKGYETKTDTFKIYPHNPKRIRWITVANIAAYGGTLVGLNALWYSKYPRSSFHFFNDNSEWLQMDKAGHIYSAYTESNVTMEAWRWAGLSRKKSIWIGGLSGVAYQSIIEILDGFSSEYGFSPGDFAANLIGSGLFISQELAWNRQKIRPKFSFHKKNYPQQDLEHRTDQLYGATIIERMMKDYNGQSYWLSANIHSFFPETKIPRWLNISAGYGAEGMFGGRENIGYDKDGNVIFDRRDIKRYRQWYLSPDIDFTQIKTNKKGIKILLFVLNSFKFPAPSLEYSNGTFKGHWVLF